MWTYEAFVNEGALLVARSQRLHRQQQDSPSALWEWRYGSRPHLPGNAFLVSRDNPRTQSRDHACSVEAGDTVRGFNDVDTAEDDLHELLTDEEEPEDPATLTAASADRDSSETILYEFHIVFHAVYQTPVLYFRLTQMDGAPVAFSPNQLRALQLPGGNARAALVAMEDHPVLGTPFYVLHPCETASAMALLLDQSAAQTSEAASLQGTGNDRSSKPLPPTYLLAWLSLVQPLTHINPLSY